MIITPRAPKEFKRLGAILAFLRGLGLIVSDGLPGPGGKADLFPYYLLYENANTSAPWRTLCSNHLHLKVA